MTPLPAGVSMKDFLAALQGPQDVSTWARVETVDRVHQADLHILAGQVDGMGTVDDWIERKASVTLHDPGEVFGGPSMNLQVQTWQRVRNSTLDVEVPTFTGILVRTPVRNYTEQTVTLELQDRSAIAMRPTAAKTYPGPANTRTTIGSLLTDAGESASWLRLGSSTDRHSDPVQVGEEEEFRRLVQARELSDALDEHLLWDTRGGVALRDYPARPMVDLTPLVTGTGEPEPTSEVVTRVKVIGKKVGQGDNKKHLMAVRFLRDVRPGHPLDPSNVKVGGVGQVLGAVTVENTKLNTQARVDRKANRLMGRYARQIDVKRTYTLVPFPLLDPYDMVTLAGDSVVVSSFTLPLTTAGGDMTLGYTVPLEG